MGLEQVDVLVVGAGPTGLALACDLARRGVRFRIVDKATSYFIGSKAKGLQPRSLEVLDDFGIVEQVLNHGKFHIPFRAYQGGKVLGEKDLHEGRNPTPSEPYASPLITPQWRVEEALRQLLERSGGAVELAKELTFIEQDDESVTATLRHAGGNEQIRCRYLIAADGGKSFVRRFLQVPFEGETWKDERMYVGDVRLHGLDREAWHSWAGHPDGWFALCPLPSTDAFQLQAQIPAGEVPEPSLELFREIAAKRTEGMKIELIDAPWMSLYQVNVRMASRYRAGRVFLAGDAAHIHSPAGGQGMNTGIQDAYNLGWKLEAVLHGAPEALLDTYEEERLPVAAHVLGLSSKLHKQITGATEENLRRDAVTLQLGITYREMSLSVNRGRPSLKISAGDRAPDAPGLDARGMPIRLFDLLRGPQFTLLRLFANEDGADWKMPRLKLVDLRKAGDGPGTGTDVFVDDSGYFETAYGGGAGDYALVRPDGYIGWTGTREHLDDVNGYLARVSGR